MRRGSLIVLAVILLFGATDLRSQSCTPSLVSTKILCGTMPPCTLTVPSGVGYREGIFPVGTSELCCGAVETTYSDGGQCIVVTGMLDQPGLQRLFEYVKTHEVLVAACSGRYLPAQAVLRMPTPSLPEQLLEKRKSVSDLGAR